MGIVVDGCDMGTMQEAEAVLAAKTHAWRELRQPSMDTRTGHRKRETAEQEARFQLANAAVMWLWHRDHLSQKPVAE